MNCTSQEVIANFNLQVELPSSSAEVIVVLDKAGGTRSPAVRLDLGHSNFHGLAVEVSADGLEIVRGDSVPPWSKDKIRYLARGAQPMTIRIFLDAGSIEVTITTTYLLLIEYV